MEMNYEERVGNGKKMIWIIGGIILVIMVVGLVYGATQRSLKQADQEADSDTVTINQSGPTSTNGTVKPVAPAANEPLAANMVSYPVTVTKLDVVNLESFPERVQARVAYELANGCAVLDTPTITKTGNAFTITMSSRGEKDANCTQALVPGEIVIEVPVEGLPAGKYSVKVGTTTKSFTLSAENKTQYYSDK